MIQQRVHRIARTASHGLAGGAGERARRSIRRFGPNEYLEVHNALSQLGVLWLSSPSNDAWVVRVRAWHQFAPDVLDVVIYRARWGTAWLRTGQSAPEMLPGVTGLDEIAALALAEASPSSSSAFTAAPAAAAAAAAAASSMVTTALPLRLTPRGIGVVSLLMVADLMVPKAAVIAAATAAGLDHANRSCCCCCC